MLGKPGLGKSTLVRRMALGLAGYGIQPLILGDLKPDYVGGMSSAVACPPTDPWWFQPKTSSSKGMIAQATR